jgi:UDP:flavonoid glycosyltransferase YjiC (YdhE family)
VYVSLGSLAVIKHDQFAEFLSGLVAAGYPFLWVLRADTVAASKGQHTTPQGSIGAVGEDKARVVAWAPQRDVLRHRAVGCFLTHAGWNSTLEAAVEGVPMVCWPFFGDQLINSRNVGAVWRTGLDMKDVCDRAVVERMVREAMESDEIRGAVYFNKKKDQRGRASSCGAGQAGHGRGRFICDGVPAARWVHK